MFGLDDLNFDMAVVLPGKPAAKRPQGHRRREKRPLFQPREFKAKFL
jgi:hypothetical protein